jgi:outer membrane protease
MRKFKKICIGIGCIAFLWPHIALWAAIRSIAVEGGVEKLTGHSTYQIGYPYTDDSGTYGGYFPFSELRFPLNIYMATFDLTLMTEKFKIQAGYAHNITDDTGYMEDSDWTTPSDTSQLDVYSESETTFKGDTCSMSIYYSIMQRDGFVFFLGGGFLYQDYSFESFDTDQWYPSNPSQAHDYVSGKTITYDVTFYIPYAGVNASYNMFSDLYIGARIAISPYTVVKDKDVHLARSPVRTAEGDYTGFSFILGLEAEYYFSDTIFFRTAFDYLYVSVSGDQHTTETDGDWWETTAEIKSSQMSFNLSLGYRFDFMSSEEARRARP